MDGCRRGDRRALQHVFQREAPALERTLARLCGPGVELEDVLQGTFEAAIRAFPRFRGEASVRSWLTRIAVCTALAQLRHPSRKRRARLELVADESALPSKTPAPSATAQARRHLALLYEHLGRLDARKRAAFILHVIEGRPMEEVAALTGAGLSTTKSRVMWARRRLRRSMERDPRCREWLADYTTRRAP